MKGDETDSQTPDFGWPYRATEFIFEWATDRYRNLRDNLWAEVSKRPFLRSIVRTFLLSSAAYLILVWVCVCYVQFPVRPFGLWDLGKWVILAGTLIWGAIGVCWGLSTIVLFLWLLLLLAISLTASLTYLCWVVWNAQRRWSAWLYWYRPAMLIGVIAVLTLATFVNGSRRFWDRPFDLVAWGTLVFIGASAWAALFCHLARNKTLGPGTPRVIVKWTLGLMIGIGAFVHWQSGSEREEYFLHKNTTEHPNDQNAWLDLAGYYNREGDRLADDPGDEEHGAPDPGPSYSEALRCFNRAVQLGASGFDVNFERATLADWLGEKQEAVVYAKEALAEAPPVSDDDAVKSLREVIARNAASQTELEQEADRKRLVHLSRRENLSAAVKWVFEVF